MGDRLNALFAFSVNSRPKTMVNFSCCVVAARSALVRRTARRVTPQPMRAAFGMDAGVDA
jgi:hypothetical protein